MSAHCLREFSSPSLTSEFLLSLVRVEAVAFTDAPLGQATAKPDLLDKAGPGGSAPAGSESTATVYAKLGSLFAAAGVVTWVAVPLLSRATDAALNLAVAVGSNASA